jgi:hypothetical protein
MKVPLLLKDVQEGGKKKKWGRLNREKTKGAGKDRPFFWGQPYPFLTINLSPVCSILPLRLFQSRIF